MLLEQQYKEHCFTKYSELIACLLIAKKNNELLLKNHQSYPQDLRHFLKPMLYQFLIIDMGVDTTMAEVMAKVVVAIILGIVIAMVYPKTRKIVPITRS